MNDALARLRTRQAKRVQWLAAASTKPYSAPPKPAPIDWILTTPGLRVSKATINTFSKDGQFPSDHLPVESWIHLG